MLNSGADILELGVPYSDPVMDGTVIARATQTALERGFKLRHVFPAVAEIVKATGKPVLVMTYWNPVVQYGVEKFATDLKAAGGAGLITPDLIPDEAADWLDISERLELERVFLAAPSSSDSRLHVAGEQSKPRSRSHWPMLNDRHAASGLGIPLKSIVTSRYPPGY